MGLDQYAYYEDSEDVQIEIAYWRKHNRLQGWMQELWESKGRPNFDESTDNGGLGDFNCIPVELNDADLDDLEAHVCNKDMPETGGFFFGDDSFEWKDEDGEQYKGKDYLHKQTDIDFIEKAKQAIKDGYKVFYNCWY
jgi:hypothetical protein